MRGNCHAWNQANAVPPSWLNHFPSWPRTDKIPRQDGSLLPNQGRQRFEESKVSIQRVLWGPVADKNLHLWLTPTDLSLGCHNRYLYRVEMALCIKHPTTPHTLCPTLVEHRVTSKMILASKVPASCVHPGFSNANDLHGSVEILAWNSNHLFLIKRAFSNIIRSPPTGCWLQRMVTRFPKGMDLGRARVAHLLDHHLGRTSSSSKGPELDSLSLQLDGC